MTQEELENRIAAYAGRCIRVCEALPVKKFGNAQLADQLFRSSTSVVANYAEATQPESRKDFVHKLKVALKELAESRAWLKIIAASGRVKPASLTKLIAEGDELARILGTSVATASGRIAAKKS